MANKPIKAKINVTKILKEHLFKGKSGTYLNLVIWPNKDGIGEYGDTHGIKQEISKEARDAGEKEPFIGNLTMPEEEAPQRRQSQPQSSGRKEYKRTDDSGDGEIPW